MEAIQRRPSAATVRGWLIERIASQAERPVEEVDPTVPLTEFGLDSVSVLVVCADLEEYLGVPVDATMVWDHPTIAALSTALGAVSEAVE